MDAGETVTKKPVLHYAFTKEKTGDTTKRNGKCKSIDNHAA